MGYKSYVNQVKATYNKAKKDICNGIGTFCVAEAQLRTPVLTGNLRRSETFDVHEDSNGVDIGVTKEAPYGTYVEKGTSKQKAQPFLEPAIMDNIAKIEQIAADKIQAHMGGD